MAEPKTRALTIRFSAQEDEILQRLSADLQISTAAVVRRAVVSYGETLDTLQSIKCRLDLLEERAGMKPFVEDRPEAEPAAPLPKRRRKP